MVLVEMYLFHTVENRNKMKEFVQLLASVENRDVSYLKNNVRFTDLLIGRKISVLVELNFFLIISV